MSESDIDAGARWNRKVEEELQGTSFGILCLTMQNIAAPWILFEAGALAKMIEGTYVCPYLIGLEPSDIPSGPLASFQAKRADRNGTLDLMRTLNKALKEKGLTEPVLEEGFGVWWPILAEKLLAVPVETHAGTPRRRVDEMIAEILDVVRGLQRQQTLTYPLSESYLTSGTNPYLGPPSRPVPLGAGEVPSPPDLFLSPTKK
jgi:hypothetical protein